MMQFIIQCAVAFAATWAFALLYHVPKKEYICCGITGAAGWGCYIACRDLQPSVVIATFFAVIVLALMSRIFAVARQCPATIFLISGIFPLVPGAGIYYTAYYFIMGDNALSAAKGVETFKIAVAIALGIAAVLALPGGVFGMFTPKKERGDR
ncbi:MAG: threonine/serine exporter family protein [Ruthenibacterium sp.]